MTNATQERIFGKQAIIRPFHAETNETETWAALRAMAFITAVGLAVVGVCLLLV